MAHTTKVTVDILSRQSGAVISQVTGDSQTVNLNQLSIVRVHATHDVVLNYERVGNDLILHMKDGSVVRYHSYFNANSKGEHSELIFDDSVHPIEHVTFVDTSVAPGTPVAVVPGYETINSVGALVLDTSSFDPAVLASVLGVVALGAGIGIAAHNRGEHSSSDDGDGNTPTLTLAAFANDNILNQSEVGISQVFSGSTTNVPVGETVTLTLNGKSYTTTVGNGGSWSITVLATDLQALADGTYVVSVSVSDGHGHIATGGLTVGVDTQAPAAASGVVLTNDSGSEITGNTSDNTPTLSGKAEPDSTVTIMDGNKAIGTVPVDSHGDWTFTLTQPLGNGSHCFTTTVTDPAGNTSTTSTPIDFVVGTGGEEHEEEEIIPDHNPPTLALDAFATDNILNKAEVGVQQVFSGTSTNVSAGQPVVLTLNGKTYTTQVGLDGAWQFIISSKDLQALVEGTYTVSVTVTNEFHQQASQDVAVTVDIMAPALTVETLTGDGYINIAESLAPITITGTASLDDVGREVHLQIDGKSYVAIVQSDGSWSTQLSADALQNMKGDFPLTITLTDAAGNSTTITNIIHVSADPTQLPTITIDAFAGGNGVDGAEMQTGQQLSGKTTNVEAGQRVNITFDGQNYTAIVQNDGSWSIIIPATVMQSLTDGTKTISVSVTDRSQNPAAIGSEQFDVNTIQEGIAIDPVTGDNKLSFAETEAGITISGTTHGVPAGQEVTINFGGHTFAVTVLETGRWSINLASADLEGLVIGGNNNLTVSVIDGSGHTLTNEINIGVFTTLPSPTLDTPFDDGYLNMAEAAIPETLRGTTGLSGAGQSVVVTIAGHSYNAMVDVNGAWSLQISAADLQALPQGNDAIIVIASDALGNSSIITSSVAVDFTAPFPTVLPPFTDGFLNIIEAGSVQTLTGSTGKTGDGQRVIVTLNGHNYTALVLNDGTWSLSLSPGDLQALPQGSDSIVIKATDAAGNATTITSSVTVDFTAPTLIVNAIAGDNQVNILEAQSAITVTGTASLSEAGREVSVLINGHTYTGTVQGDGTWTLSIAAGDLSNQPNGTYLLVVSLSDSAGNTTTDTVQLVVKTDLAEQPTLSVNIFATDDIIDGAERNVDQILSGATTNVEAGQQVRISIGTTNFIAIVQADGSWSTTVPPSVLQSLADGIQTIQVNVSDKAGNSAAEISHDFELNSIQSGLAFNVISGDGNINATEAAAGVTLSGTSTEVVENSIVLVTFNGNTYQAIVGADGTWTVNIPSTAFSGLADGPALITISTTDTANLPVTGSTDVGIYIHNLPDPTITPPFGDGLLNITEAATNGTLTGTTGVIGSGQTVTVTLNGKEYSATVDDSGAWRVVVPATDLSALTDGTDYAIGVQATDVAGNTSATPVLAHVTADFSASILTVATIAGDGIINHAEEQANILVTGTASLSEVGQTVSVLINGVTYSGPVLADGTYTVTLPAGALDGQPNGAYPVNVSLTDVAGNTTTATASVELMADPTLLPTVSIDVFAHNGVVDGAERKVDQILSGTTANVEAGQVVTIIIGTLTYNATVQASGAWSTTIPSADLQALADGTATISVQVADVAGNSTSGSGSFSLNSNQSGLAFDPISGDGNLNVAEAAAGINISGTSVNVNAGSVVLVTLNGITYNAMVNADGTWSTQVPSSALTSLTDGPNNITISAADSAGNPLVVSTELGVYLHSLPEPVLNMPFVDGLLGSTEASATQTLSGTTGVSGDGQKVVITLGGQSYDAVVNNDGSWTASIPGVALTALDQGTQPITVVATDAAGNSNNTTGSVIVDFTAPTLTVGPISSDNIVNYQEAADGFTLNGTASVSEVGREVILTIGAQTYTATVLADGSWSTNIPAGAFSVLLDGTHQIVANLTDVAGNKTAVSHDFNLVVHNVPTPIINTPFVDGYLNKDEAAAQQTLSGETGVLGAGQQVVVTLGGVEYPVSADSNGVWNVNVPSSALVLLTEGQQSITVTVTDAAGNVSSATSVITVDLTPPILTINPVATDDIINAAESLAAVTISGTADMGSSGLSGTVMLMFNNQPYSAVVHPDGSWSLILPSSVIQSLQNGEYQLSATLVDAAGNSTTITHSFTIDAAADSLPTLTINAISTDDYINQTEKTEPLVLSGTSTHLEQGQIVTVHFNGSDYQATVTSDGSWTVTVPAGDLATVGDGLLTVAASTTDVAGNPASASHNVTVIAAVGELPTLTINVVSDDDRINALEHNQPLVLSGSSTHILEGQIVSVTFNGKSYQATVVADGTWTVIVPLPDVQALAEGVNSVTATAEDVAQNVAIATHDVTVDIEPPTISVSVDAGADAILNLVEAQTGLPVSGVTESGLTVTITFNNQIYTTVAGPDGHWSYTIPKDAILAITADGTTTVKVSVADAAGNVSTSSTTFELAVNVLPTVVINPISVDNIINISEAANGFAVSGTATHLDGQTIYVTVGMLAAVPVVVINGAWSLAVAAGAISGTSDNLILVSVSATDTAGNTTAINSSLELDLSPVPVPTIDTLFGDGRLNAVEAGSVQIITGSTNMVGSGQTVTVTVGGTAVTATVDVNGHWTATVPASLLGALADGTATVSVVVIDKGGNTNSANLDFSVAVHTLPHATVDSSFGPDLNIAEAAVNQTLVGVTNVTGEGQSVVINWHGTDYTATVDAAGSWSLVLTPAMLTTLPTGDWTIRVTAQDIAGNTDVTVLPISVHLEAPAAPTIDQPFGDGVLNHAESVAITGQVIAGSTGFSGTQTVTVTITGVTTPIATTVDSATGLWTATLTTAQLAQIAADTTDPTFSIIATVTDQYGNTSTTSSIDFTTALTLPTPTITADFGSVLNIDEAAGVITITGTTGVTGIAQTVKLVVDANGLSYPATVDAATGIWTVSLPAGVLSTLDDNVHSLNVTVTDANGNSNTGSLNFMIDFAPPSIAVNPIFGDGYLNHAEAAAGASISGITNGSAVSISINGVSYQATINAGVWTLDLTPAQLAAIPQGQQTFVVTAIDENGNPTSVNVQVDVITQLPTITMNAFAGDNNLDYAESLTPQTLSGTSANLAVGQVITITAGAFIGTATVQPGGTWSLSVPSSALANFAGVTDITTTATDAAGNHITSDQPITVDLTPPSTPILTIDPVSGDNVVNASDSPLGNLTVTGHYSGVTVDILHTLAVTLTVDGILFGAYPVTFVEGSSGAWFVTATVPLALLTDGNKEFTATLETVLPVPGEVIATATETILVDRTPPVVTINNFAVDNVLNGTEAAAGQSISGTASVTEQGRIVTIQVSDSKTYYATVGSDGSWSANVTAADLQALSQGLHTITASMTDAAGNPSNNASLTFTTDTSSPLLGINLVAGDNILNLVEATAGTLLTGTTSAEDGQLVTVKVAGATVGTATVDGGHWSFQLLPNNLTGLLDGNNVISASITDKSGNTTSVDITFNVIFNKLLSLDITDGIGVDNVLNFAASLVTQTISGTATSAGVGAIVTLTGLGSTPLTAVVGADGKWGINVLPDLLGELTNGNHSLSLIITDAVGNVSVPVQLIVDVAKVLPVLGALDSIEGSLGTELNAAELATVQTVSGVATAANGSIVILSIGGNIFTGSVTDNHYSVSIPVNGLANLVDGMVPVILTVTDPVGNTVTQTVNSLNVVTHNLPQIELDPPFGDDLLNVADLANVAGQTLTGTIKNMAVGTTVMVSIGGSTAMAATVDAASGHFSLNVPSALLNSLLAGVITGSLSIEITATDVAGNVVTTPASVDVDLSSPIIKLDPPFTDGLLNATDALVEQTINGLVTGVAANTPVSVQLGAKTLFGVTDANGRFSIVAQPGDLQLLPDGSLDISVTVTDSSGNSTTISTVVEIITHSLPQVDLGTIFSGDGFLNAVEAGSSQTINGTIINGTVGSLVTLTLGALSVNGVVAADGKSFSVLLKPTQLASLSDGTQLLSVTVTDVTGNSSTTSINIDVAIHDLPSFNINPIFGDGVLSVGDLLSPQTISGVATNVAEGSQIAVSLGTVKNYIVTVGTGGNWIVNVPITDLKLLTTDGTITVSVSYTDAAGNIATSTPGLLTVNANALPTIHLDTPFADGLLNAAEALLTQTLTGTTTNAVGATVTLTLGGIAFAAQVKADGTFSLSLTPAILAGLLDGSLHIDASITNSAGQSASTSATATVGIHTLPTMVLGSIFGGDGYLNLSEASTAEIISGTTNLNSGTVAVTLNGVTHNGMITNGAWSVSFSATELKAIADGTATVNVKLADTVGNVTSQDTSLVVKTHGLPLIALDPLGSLAGIATGVLTHGLTMTGKSLNLQTGAIISVTLLGSTLTGTVLADGSWTVRASSSVFDSLNIFNILSALTSAIIGISATDLAGNGISINVGLVSGSILPIQVSGNGEALPTDDTHSLASVSTTSETSHITPHSPMDTSADDATVVMTGSLTDTQMTADTGNLVVATTTEHIESVFSIGGMTIDLTEANAVAVGGTGNDIIEVYNLNFSHIDGGSGVDTLLLAGNDQHLDLTALGLKVEHIDIFDLGQSGTNSISLNLHESLTVKDVPDDHVIIKGAEGSLVNLVVGTDGAWSEVGQKTVEGLTFDVYHNASADTSNTLGDILVQQGILVHNV